MEGGLALDQLKSGIGERMAETLCRRGASPCQMSGGHSPSVGASGHPQNWFPRSGCYQRACTRSSFAGEAVPAGNRASGGMDYMF